MTLPSTSPMPSEADLRYIQKLTMRQREFFASNKTLDVFFRKEQLLLLQEAIKKYEQELYDAMYADFRKPEMEAYATEVGFVELEIKFTLKNLAKWAKREPVKESFLNFPAKSYIYYEPYGVVLIIGPWNYPFQLLINPLIGAIAAGNCAIIKPSELTPATSGVIAKMIRETFDEAYVAVVEGGPKQAQYLIKQRFDFIFFTGSTRVGKVILQAAAEHLTPVTLELGGKSPAIVADDADLELAARRIAWGKFLNAGQTCVAPDYVLVQEQVKEEFIHLLSQCISDFYGEDPALSQDYARIVNDYHFNRLSRLLSNGVIRAGGQTDSISRYIAPTLLDQVTWQDPIMQEEIFGPILPIISVKCMKEAVSIVNKHEKPLALYIFSSNSDKKKQILQEAHFGGGCVNDTVSHLINSNLPFGGVGGSGMGSYHGKSSFTLFSHQKSVLHRGTWVDMPLRYPPYKDRLPMLRKLFNWL